MIQVPVMPYDFQLFRQWYQDLKERPERAGTQVLEEIAVRLRRMAMDGFEAGTVEAPAPKDLTRLQLMTQFVLQRFRDDIRVEDVAESAGLSVAMARRLFKRYLGMGVHQFVRRMRLAQAHKLLAQGASSVLAVSLEVGFSSLSGFYTAFEEIYGVQPGVVRGFSESDPTYWRNTDGLFHLLTPEPFQWTWPAPLASGRMDPCEHSASKPVEVRYPHQSWPSQIDPAISNAPHCRAMATSQARA